jgi:signal transduction histidine kinase
MTAPHTDDPSALADSADARAPTARDIERQVRAAQAALVVGRARSSGLFGPVVGAVACGLLWDGMAHARLVFWYALLVSGTVWREVVYQRFIRDNGANALTWGRQHELALLGHGLVYGLIGTLLLPIHEPILVTIMLATIMAIASVGVVVLSTSLTATLAFTLPVLLPTIVAQLVDGTRFSSYIGLAMTLLLIMIAIEGRKASKHTLAMLRLRFTMDDLASQRQQALDQAQRSSAVKGQFLATMSHEMRTPLHGILGVTRLLRSTHTTGDARARAHRLEMIERTGEHLLGLINDVLDYSKIEGGHLRLEAADFDLAALVESVADLARVSAAEKCLTLKLELSTPSPCWVRSDASRLRQVLMNLTGNAVKFTERGAVTIAVRRQSDGTTSFEVIDTGPGIAMDQSDAIFDAFHQVDGSFGRRHGGTGLGLTISRELARSMGGDLACVESPSGGARFMLTLPLPVAAAAAPRLEPCTLLPVLRGRVLVAEDNPVNALVAEAMLRNTGLSVDIVVDGAQAVERAAATPYDLILMDCQMPGMDGFEATARIRAMEHAAGGRAVPIVALTANALASDRQRSIAAGMDDHLAKPFREQDLVGLMQRYLA